MTANLLTGYLRLALLEVAKAELAGAAIGGRDIALRLGAAESTGISWRSKLLGQGLVQVTGRVGNVTALGLTPKGWEAIGGRAAVKPAASGPKERACLCCGSTFLSEWSGHRLCGACRGQSGDDTYRILPR